MSSHPYSKTEIRTSMLAPFTHHSHKALYTKGDILGATGKERGGKGIANTLTTAVVQHSLC